jgi:nitroreductase/NAD-dependent dihydropyrimidine dehydrogenase PreA subunit
MPQDRPGETARGDRLNTTTIDADRCVGCGRCVAECPRDTLELIGGKAVATGEHSMGCDHCAAVCPEGAIDVGFVDGDVTALSTLDVADTWLPHGEFPTADLVQLMRSRRSCRHFRSSPVPLDVLQDLVRIGMAAPSGTNSQLWTFTIVPDRASIEALGDGVLGFFRKLNKMVEKRSARLASRFMKGDPLNTYADGYYERIRDGIREYDEKGTDLLFRGAPAAIIVGSEPGASTPTEDALLASQNILLAAHAMGYGTCLIGFAVAAMSKKPRIKRIVGIPKDEKVHAVIIVGEPAHSFERVTRRGAATVRVAGRP